MLASLGTIELSLKPLEPSQHYRVERFKGLSSIGRTFLPRDAVSFGSFLQPGLLAAEGFQIQINRPFMPTVPTFAVRETDVSRHNGGTSGAPHKPLRDDSALRALSSLRGLRGAPKVPPLCRETSVSRTANVGTVGKNWLKL